MFVLFRPFAACTTLDFFLLFSFCSCSLLLPFPSLSLSVSLSSRAYYFFILLLLFFPSTPFPPTFFLPSAPLSLSPSLSPPHRLLSFLHPHFRLFPLSSFLFFLFFLFLPLSTFFSFPFIHSNVPFPSPFSLLASPSREIQQKSSFLSSTHSQSSLEPWVKKPSITLTHPLCHQSSYSLSTLSCSLLSPYFRPTLKKHDTCAFSWNSFVLVLPRQ